MFGFMGIGVYGGRTERINIAGDQIARGIPVFQPYQPVQPVIHIPGNRAVGIRHSLPVSDFVIGISRHSAVGVGDRFQSVQSIISVSRRA